MEPGFSVRDGRLPWQAAADDFCGSRGFRIRWERCVSKGTGGIRHDVSGLLWLTGHRPVGAKKNEAWIMLRSVAAKGLEPSLPFGNLILNQARLPIPPRRHR